jgi:hypothetical protein
MKNSPSCMRPKYLFPSSGESISDHVLSQINPFHIIVVYSIKIYFVLLFNTSSGVSLSAFPCKHLCACLISIMRATCPAHIIIDLIVLILDGETCYKSKRSSLWSCFEPVTSAPPPFWGGEPCSQTPSVKFFPSVRNNDSPP